MWNRTIVAALLAAAACAGAQAQDSSPVDFGRIPGVAAEPNVEVDLNAAMLAFVTEAAKASGASSADAAAALSGLKHVRVRVYEELKNPAAVQAFVESSSTALERAGWQRTVYVTDNDEKVRVYVKLQNQTVSGMNVMVVDGDDEAVFINIDGSIEPAQLGQLMRMAGAGDVLDSFGQAGRGFDRARHGRHGGHAPEASASSPGAAPEAAPAPPTAPASPAAAVSPAPTASPAAPEAQREGGTGTLQDDRNAEP